jgi:tetraacyldisaccharide 4'-kinase
MSYLRIFLIPFSWLWENLYRLRRLCFEYGIFKRDIFDVPVVSVGNLTFGGTGKTPFIIYLVEYFESLGLTPMVLTRGYKGDLEYAHGIILGGQKFKSNPLKYGDEPLLIARHLKRGAVVVGKSRSKNLIRYFYQVRPDVVLLDDGFQHLKIFRNCNLVLFDATMPMDKLKVAPLGYLREGLSSLKDADIIIFNKTDLAEIENLKKMVSTVQHYLPPHTPIFKIRYVIKGLYNAHDELIFDSSSLRGLNVFAVAALASPIGFFKMLEESGANVVGTQTFADHHFFTREDINKMLIEATHNSAIIVATQKDIVKLRKIVQHENILYLSINIEFLTSELSFQTKLVKALSLDSRHPIALE